MVKYVPGDKVKIVRDGYYHSADESDPTKRSMRGGINLAKNSTCVLICGMTWPHDGWWIAKWGRVSFHLHESDFELTNLLEIIARAATDSHEL